MPTKSQFCAWSGLLPELVSVPTEAILPRLLHFVPDASVEQIDAWRNELGVLQREGAQVLHAEPTTTAHGALLEYTLPREGGRRPDVLVLQCGRVVVLEFKEASRPKPEDIDQVLAYARDLAHYHSGCDGMEVTPVLVLVSASKIGIAVDGVHVVSANGLGQLLLELGRSTKGPIAGTRQILEGEYAPLPTLVAAARLLFENLELPFVKRARSAGVHRAVDQLLQLAQSCRQESSRRLVLLTGVPGAGKTLVGLQVAHSAALEEGFRFGRRQQRGSPATFLSGNGPLVQVLQNALRSTAFVRDMHAYIREYGLLRPDLIPKENVVIFDEAQRAWDAPKVKDFYSKKLSNFTGRLDRSEPELLLSAAMRIPEWSIVLALVGNGQEIHTGEEAGLTQWAEAARQTGGWKVHGPAKLAPLFYEAGVQYQSKEDLDLDTSLRFHSAIDLHDWVNEVIDQAALEAAGTRAARLRNEGFPIYVTRSLEAAKSYLKARFGRERLRRYGLLASSKANNLTPFGVDPTFQATKRLRIGDWFNAEPEHPRSCTQLVDVVTEFQCQGLELDLSLVCWGDDFRFEPSSARWAPRPERRSALRRDPEQLRRNAYRVLLTRGREGMLLWVPPTTDLDATHQALLRSGAVALERDRIAAVA